MHIEEVLVLGHTEADRDGDVLLHRIRRQALGSRRWRRAGNGDELAGLGAHIGVLANRLRMEELGNEGSHD